MNGSLNDILPEPISEENERILLEHLKDDIKIACHFSVSLLHAMEERFGPEAREVVRDMIQHPEVESRPDPGDPETDLRSFCDALDRVCVGSHRWERVVDEPGRIGYHYTRCMWAEAFRELGEPELGFLWCAGDDPGVRAFNPRLGFERTQVLMHGDPLCDHVFKVEPEDPDEPGRSAV